ncbi:MAG: tetratricopeptide repeat protein [Bacteroidales bacterium]
MVKTFFCKNSGRKRQYIFIIIVLSFFTLLSRKETFAQTQEQAFRKALRYADSVYSTGDLKSARAAYLFAQRMNPAHQGIQSRLTEIDRQLTASAQSRPQALQWLYDAELAIKNNELEKAESALTSLQKLKTLEPDILQKYNDLLNLYKQKIEIENQYKANLKQAEDHVAKGYYEQARELAQQALQLRPDDGKTLSFIALLEKKKQQALTQFEPIFREAKANYEKGNYSQASALLTEALVILPEHKEGNNLLSTCKGILAYQQEMVQLYTSIIQRADKAYAQGNFSEALALYRQAIDVNPDEDYPKLQIQSINTAAVDQKTRQEQYTLAIRQADDAFKASDWEKASSLYGQALTFKPGDKYALNRKKEAEALWAEFERIEDNYNHFIAQGDSLLSIPNYEQAIAAYSRAKQIKPNENYPKEKLNYINNVLATQREARKKFDQLLAATDQSIKKLDWNTARNNLRQAMELIPNEPLALQKLSQIEQAEQKQLVLNSQYSNIIQRADSMMEKARWQEAADLYASALSIKPKDSYAQNKLSEARSKIKQSGEFASALAVAERFLEAQKYVEAKSAYEKLNHRFPAEPLSMQRIRLVDSLINNQRSKDLQFAQLVSSGDSLLKVDLPDQAIEKYDLALVIKPNDSPTLKKINAARARKEEKAAEEARVAGWIIEADQHFSANRYGDASILYQKVLNIRPNNSYALKQLTLSDSLNKIMLARMDKTSRLLAQADQAFNARKWQEALDSYQQLLALEPNQTYASARIEACQKEIDNEARLAREFQKLMKWGDSLVEKQSYAQAKERYQQAMQIRPNDQTSLQKLASVEQTLKELQQKEELYTRLLREEDSLETLAEWKQARQRLEQAYALKPSEGQLKSRIENLNRLIMEAEAREASFVAAMKKGEAAFAGGQWETSVEHFNEALRLKPGNAQAEAALAEVKIKIAEREALERQYKALIRQADSVYTVGALEEALRVYGEAQKLKPSEAYPPRRISQIEKQLSDIAFIERSYNKSIATADSCFETRLYNDALKAYMRASHFKANEVYPKERIQAINQLLTTPRAVEGITYEKALEAARKDEKDGRWGLAFDNYLIALHLEPHRKEAAVGLQKALSVALSDTGAVIEKRRIMLNAGAGNRFELPGGISKSNTLLVITLEKQPAEDSKIVVNYGKGGTTTGGMVVRVLRNPVTNTFIGQLGGQTGWDDENRWIRLIPEPASLQVETIFLTNKP